LGAGKATTHKPPCGQCPPSVGFPQDRVTPLALVTKSRVSGFGGGELREKGKTKEEGGGGGGGTKPGQLLGRRGRDARLAINGEKKKGRLGNELHRGKSGRDAVPQKKQNK